MHNPPRPIPLAALALALAVARGVTAQVTTAPYAALDRIEDDWINRNPIPTRPMAFATPGSVWAANPYLSTVNRVEGSAVVQTFATLPGPVALATWTPSGGPAQVVAVCQHANAVVFHDAGNGDVLATLATRAQPQDLLIDAAGQRLWVACAAADVVMEFDLADRTAPPRLYPIPAKMPTALTFSPEGEVLVAPRASGNGSLSHRAASRSPSVPTTMAGSRGILDTLQASVASMGLEDHDLFWLDRSAGIARPVFRSMGTMLFGGAMRPGGREYWQLNTDANNKDPLLQSEAAIRGDIVANRVSIGVLPTLTPSIALGQPAATMIVDDTAPASPDPIGNPYSLVFNADGTRCYVVGLLTDNVLELDGGGSRTGRNIRLADGTMPRQVLLDAAGQELWVWGGDSSVTRIPTSTFVPAPIDLGFDPTPARLRRGRALFFDASRSLRKNASCASCHDEGKTDMLVWNLSKISAATGDGPDNKGPMVTQTLVGIAKAAPFHWRGEQREGLRDFNGAFDALLGGAPFQLDNPSTSDPQDFEDFEAYILSLTEDANQFAHPARILDDDLLPPPGSSVPDANPILGQVRFNQPGQCSRCHPMPTGSSNEIVSNDFTDEPLTKRLWLKTASFQGLQFKGSQARRLIALLNPTEAPLDYARIGTGLAHAGVNPDVHEFSEIMIDGADVAHVANFLHQFDTGIAPAAHTFVLARASTLGDASTATRIGDLLAQASASSRNCDVAVIGRIDAGGTMRPVRWVYERDSDTFRRDDNQEQILADLFASAQSDPAWLVFLGLPPGTGRGFAIDYDRDQLPNALEPAITGAEFTVDSDNDGHWDGLEFFNMGDPGDGSIVSDDHTRPTVTYLDGSLLADPSVSPFQWVTQRVARLTFTTDELTQVELSLTSADRSPHEVVVKETLAKLQHDLLVSSLLPGRVYSCTLTVTDLAGNPAVTASPIGFTFSLPTKGETQNAAIVSSLSWPAPSEAAGVYTFTASCTVTDRRGAALPNMIVVARVFVDGVLATAADHGVSLPPGSATILRVDGVRYSLLPPPLLISGPTDAAGHRNLVFSIDRPPVGSKIELAIEAIGKNLGPNTVQFPGGSPPQWRNIRSGFGRTLNIPMPGAWSFPDTAKNARSLEFIVR